MPAQISPTSESIRTGLMTPASWSSCRFLSLYSGFKTVGSNPRMPLIWGTISTTDLGGPCAIYSESIWIHSDFWSGRRPRLSGRVGAPSRRLRRCGPPATLKALESWSFRLLGMEVSFRAWRTQNTEHLHRTRNKCSVNFEDVGGCR